MNTWRDYCGTLNLLALSAIGLAALAYELRIVRTALAQVAGVFQELMRVLAQ